MSWKKHEPFLLMAAATLSSVAFCLDTGPREPNKVIRYGTLVVGHHNRGILNETVGDLEAKLHDEAAGDSERYQADQPEATVNQLAELKLQRLRPSVRCDNDSMTLRLLGRRVPDFLVERGEESPVPLSEIPAHCGFSVKRARRDVFLVAKYDGCHITQQGDSYILPLRMWDTPVKMSCSVAAPLKVSCLPSAMVIELGVSVDTIKLKVSGGWQPMVQACSTCGFTLEAVAIGWIITAPYTSNCYQTEGAHRLLSVLYMYEELTLSCPVVQAPASTLPPADELPPVPTAPQAPADRPFPYGYAVPGFWPFHHGHPSAPPNSPIKSTGPTSTSSATASSTPTKASADEQLWYAYPYDYDRPWPFYHSHPGAPPNSPTLATKTTGPTTTPTLIKASADQQLWYPYMYGYAWPFYLGYPPAPPKSTTVAPTTTSPSTTASTSTEARTDEQFWYPYGYAMPRPWPFYPARPRVPPKSSTAAPQSTGPTSTATTPTKASADQLWYPYRYAVPRPWPFYSGYPGAPTKSPTVSPETTAPTTTVTTVKPPSDDQQLSYLFPWLPAVYDPSVPMLSQSLPVSAPARSQTKQMPWIFDPRRHSEKDQKHSLPVDDALAVSQSAPFSRTGADLQPVYPHQKWYYPMYQLPYASQQKPASSVVNPSTAVRHDQHGVPQLYSLYYAPPKQSSRDIGTYPLMSKPAYDQVSASRWWKSVAYPVQLSPLLVKARRTNRESDLTPTENVTSARP